MDPILAQLDPFCKCIKTAISCDVFFDFLGDVSREMVGFKGARDPNNISYHRIQKALKTTISKKVAKI